MDAERINPRAKRYVTPTVARSAPPYRRTEPALQDGRVIGCVTSGGTGWRNNQIQVVGWIDANHSNLLG